MSCPIFNLSVHNTYYNDIQCGLDFYRLDINIIGGESNSIINGVIQYMNDGVLNNIHFINDNESTTTLYYEGHNSFLKNGFDVYIYSNDGTCVSYINQPVLICEESEPELSSGGNYCFITTCDGSFTLSNAIRGCTNPESSNYNPNATIDDGNCASAIRGCMNPLATNYNGKATIDDGSCIFDNGGNNLIISGCTDNRYVEYNPNATIDDGSCLNVRYGCNNPLAINYNPNAFFNDGSCIFLSGCTNENAPNYSALAVVDDGSCLCSSPSYLIDKHFYYDPICEYEIELTLKFKIDAQSFLNYIANNNKSIIGTINLINFDICFYNIIGNDCFNQFFENNFEIIGDNQYISLFNEILANELNKDCTFKITDYYNNNESNFKVIVPKNENTLLFGIYTILKFNNINFEFKCDIIDFKLIKNCKKTVTTNTLNIPNNNVLTVVDNIKSDLFKKEIFNSKEVDLYIDYSKYLENDIFEYLTKNKKYIYTAIQDNLNLEKLERVNSYHTNPNFVYNLIKQMYYNNIFDYCNIKSKKLNYDIFFKFNKISILKQWTDFVKDFIPATTKWEYNNILIKNTNLDNSKFLYKKGIVYNGINTDINAQHLVFEENINNDCKPTFVDFQFNQNLPLHTEKNTNKILIHNFDNQHYGMGRILTKINENKTVFDYPLVERN